MPISSFIPLKKYSAFFNYEWKVFTASKTSTAVRNNFNIKNLISSIYG